MEIGKLLTAVGLSVQQAQEVLSQKHVGRYMQYFDTVNPDDTEADSYDTEDDNAGQENAAFCDEMEAADSADGGANGVREESENERLESENIAEESGEEQQKTEVEATDENSEVLCPKMIRFSLGGDEQKCVDVPIATMVSHESLGLKRVKVTISGKMHQDMESQDIMMSAGSLQPEGTDVHNGTIEMIFENEAQPEGQARANQKMLDKMEI